MPIVGMNNQARDAEFAYRQNMEKSSLFEQKKELERIRQESAVTCEDDDKNVWKYVVEDDGTVCVLNCRAGAPSVRIPDEFEGKPVRAIEADAFKENAQLEEIICAEGITKIGLSAFRRNAQLKRVAFPESCDNFDGTWLQNCPKLEEVVLPGALEHITPAVLASPSLRSIVLGKAAREVAPGMFERSNLEEIRVNPGNSTLKSDGKALYSADGETLVALAVGVQHYVVAAGTKRIADKALATFPCLTSVELPDSVEELGVAAFSRAGIREFHAPSGLKRIGERAFYGCKSLREVVLNEGLEELGDSIFCETSIESLEIPASVHILGGKVANDGALVYSGHDRTFSIAPGSPHFFLDEDGGLYRMIEGGCALVRMMNPDIEEYELQRETRIIEERAFYRHAHIRKVILPDGLEKICEAAFRGAEALEEAVLPSTMKELEREAFYDTSIKSVYIGKGLVRIGELALVTKGAHKGTMRTIEDVTVESGNERYYVVPGLLMERRANGRERVLLGIDNERHVEIPLQTTSVAAYAMHGAHRIKELYLSDRINDVEMRGLAIDSALDLLHIDFKEPIEGHDCIEFRYPKNENTRKEINLSLGMPQFVDVETIAGHYDSIVMYNQTHNKENRATIGLYEQAIRAIERLKDPLFLMPVSRSLYHDACSRFVVDICEQAARHDDRRTIDDLIELGYLTKDTISAAIERVGLLQDAAMTGYLLEKKHELVEESGGSFLDDFEL